MFKFNFKIWYKVFLILLTAIISSHYLEPYENGILKKVRNLIYFGVVNDQNQGQNSNTTHYKYIDKPVINPVNIAQKVIDDAEGYLFDKYYSEKKSLKLTEVHRANILNIADWFIDSYNSEIIEEMDVVRLHYDFPLPTYKLKSPWYSGMAQSLAIVIQLAAYDLTKDERYINFAKLLGNMYDIKVKDGGVKVEVDNGYWYEEYADPSHDSIHYPLVLNGHNFALDGLFWLSHFDKKNDKWNELLKKGILAVEKNIYKYETYFWSYYDQKQNYADFGYHQIHINQTTKLLNFYGKLYDLNLPNIETYHNKFELYKRIPLAIFERLFFMHNRMLIVIILTNFFILLFIYFIFLKLFKKHNL